MRADNPPHCPFCAINLDVHTGLIATCYKLQIVKNEVTRLRTALADAIRSPMGVVPDSAVGLITDAELEAAEKRRQG